MDYGLGPLDASWIVDSVEEDLDAAPYALKAGVTRGLSFKIV